MALTNTNGASSVQIISMGGLGEIGKNTWLFRYEDEILMLDGGLSFPSSEMLGVNIVLPDMTWLQENQEKIVGMVVTHGHEDHIGGIPYHLQRLTIPRIWGPRLAMSLLEGKLKETGLLGRVNITRVGPRDKIRAGRYFEVEYIHNTHSIADSYTLAITTPAGVIIHSGDFKFDHTPVDGRTFDYQRLAEYGEKGVMCLISDSTNAEVPGFTPSERAVFPNLDREFAAAKGRIILTTFASSIHRVNMTLQLAQKHNRVVSVLGRSMLNVMATAKQLGFITYPEELLQPIHVCRTLPDNQVLILTTGSQGEPLAAMTRIAKGEHKQVSIKQGDTVIFSANPIPGNTIPVVRTIDKLMELGAQVIYGKEKGIHVSGHGAQEDHKMMLALTKPKFFFPAHGELRMLRAHARTAMSMGVPEERIVIAMNGDVIAVSANEIKVVDRVRSGVELLDSSRVGIVEPTVLKDRQRISEEGMVVVAVAVNNQGQILAAPSVTVRAVARTPGMQKLEQDLAQTTGMTVLNGWSTFARAGGVDWEGLRVAIEKAVQVKLRNYLPSRPLVLIQLQTTGGPITTTAPELPALALAMAIAPEPVAPPSLEGRIRRRRTEVAPG
ncbi:ribonuclease J [Candidatus Cyanaurora vandensis]|uniref:ribonuclease J n=1 Tax=Candidatus Cyanaurora vandensis TaxID=2714958 RepID=UPI00257BB4D3|nr:ribonuclease J [Candidatus Cyanaurora vandensis]